MTTMTSPTEPVSMTVDRPTLLVVDDEPGPRDSLRMVFQRDFNVQSFDNGLDAVEYVRRNRVHVAILDLCMGGIDGIETLRRLKEADPAIEAIMLTAYSDMNSTVAALRLSACDYQKKPFNVPELEAAVKRALQRRQRSESIRSAESRVQTLFSDINAMAEREAKLLATATTLEGVIHDMNNPLTVVMGYAQLLAGRIESAKSSGASLDAQAMEADIDVIRRHIEICTKITDRYHALNRKGHAETWSDVAQTLNDFQMFAAAHTAIKMSRLAVHRFAGKALVPISSTELVQILINLTANAFQHGGPTSNVTVDVHLRQEPLDVRTLPGPPNSAVRCKNKFINRAPFIQFTVSDRGSGMTPEVLSRIFEPHFTTKPEKSGTGLGLAIVEGLVGTAHGLVQVTSRPGQGTMFTITFGARLG